MLLLVAPGLCSAVEMEGRRALGYYDSQAPIGARFWMSDKLGLDIGVGLIARDTGNDTDTDFYLEGGVPIVLIAADRTNLFVRPGLATRIGENSDSVTLTLAPGVEVFFGDRFSMEVAHGIALQFVMPDGGDTRTNFQTFSASITALGFHFYF